MKSTEDYRTQIQAKVRIDERGCWLWQGCIHPQPDPYGMTYAFGKSWRVHRLAYHLWRGPIPEGLVVCHTCDVKHCCNPDHLWVGTEKQNMQDAAKKKIWSRQRRTHCPRGHPYSGDNLYINPRGRRNCKECSRIRQRLAAREIRAGSKPPGD